MVNYAGAATGAISGAATGASIGGIPGAIFGGLAGGTAGLFGKKKKKNLMSTFDPQQKQLAQNQYQSFFGEGPLSDLYNFDSNQANNVFDQTVANPAYQNFEENIIPGITGQFRSQGLQQSSYAGDALSRAGRDVQTGLDAQRAKYQFSGQQNAQNAQRGSIESFLNRNTQTVDSGPPEGFDINSILKSIGPAAAKSLADYFSKNPEGVG